MSQFEGLRIMYRDYTAFNWAFGVIAEVIDADHVRVVLDGKRGHVILEPHQTFVIDELRRKLELKKEEQ